MFTSILTSVPSFGFYEGNGQTYDKALIIGKT